MFILLLMSEVKNWETDLVELASDVYAYIQSGGTWFISNAGLIVGQKNAVAIDSLASKEMVEDFLNRTRKVTEKPIEILINTHFHGDHTYTNHLYPEATTITDEVTRKQTEEASEEEIELYSQVWPEIDFSEAKINPQDITFREKATIFQDGREIRLISVGAAHTKSDLYVYLPEEQIVFCGDLLFYQCTPFALFGHIPGYIRAIDQLANLNAESYVPGHGPVCGKEGLYEAREYLEMVRDEAYERFQDGFDFFEAAKDIDLGRFEDWGNPERIVGNVARAYSEFRGESEAVELDYGEIISKMLEY